MRRDDPLWMGKGRRGELRELPHEGLPEKEIDVVSARFPPRTVWIDRIILIVCCVLLKNAAG